MEVEVAGPAFELDARRAGIAAPVSVAGKGAVAVK